MSKDFRNWIEDHGGQVEDLPEDTFRRVDAFVQACDLS